MNKDILIKSVIWFLVILSCLSLQPAALSLDGNLATFILFLLASALLGLRMIKTQRIPNSGIQHIYSQLILITGGLILLASRFSLNFHDILFILGIGLIVLGLYSAILGFEKIGNFVFPLFVLFSLIPLITVMDSVLSFPMRRLSTLIAGQLLSIGIDNIIVTGTELTSATVTLSVTSACDGLTLFQHMIWISWLYSLSENSQNALSRFGLVTSVLSAVLIANSLRVVILFLAAYGWGAKILNSEWHVFISWGAVAIAVVIFSIMYKSYETGLHRQKAT